MYKWVPESNPSYIGFALLCFVIGPETCQPIRRKLKTNHDLVAHVFPRFGHFAFFFLSSHWLVKVFSSPMIAYVITLLLLLRHPIEKRPKSAEENWLKRPLARWIFEDFFFHKSWVLKCHLIFKYTWDTHFWVCFVFFLLGFVSQFEKITA